MHALRDHFASMLLAAGMSIRDVAEYLGRSDPAFPPAGLHPSASSSDRRARRVVDDLFDGSGAPDGLATA